jgi:hypothetical protein
MRFSRAVAIAVLGISVSGFAQKNDTFKVKRSSPEKAKKSAPIGKTGSSSTASASASKDLQTIERQTAKSPAPSRSAAKNAPRASSALKPVKDKPNPPINFGGTGTKNAGMHNQGANPYRGRLKQKASTRR